MGTNDALAHVSDLIYNKLDKSLPTVGVFLDLAKAFDIVNFDILLTKLELYGIRGIALELFRNYLYNRSQFVKLDGSRSEVQHPRTGVPQGTVLGPLLFLIYINDIFDILPDNTLISYADDTIVLCSASTWDLVINLVNKYLSKIYHWLYVNKLSLNVSKTVYQTFSNHCDCVLLACHVIINDTEINRVYSCKYLGVIIDYRFKWHEHIANIVKKTKYLIFLFAKLRKILSYKMLMAIYYGLFNSIATYGIISWGSAYDTTVSILCNIQKKILKLISNAHEKRPLNILQNYALNSIIYNYNYLRNTFKNSNSTSRHKTLQLPRTRNVIGKKTYKYTSIEIINKFPTNLKKICNLNNIKLLKEWIQKNYE